MNQDQLSYIIPSSDYTRNIVDLYKYVPWLRYDHLKTQKEVQSLISAKQAYLERLLVSYPEYYTFMCKIRIEIDMLWQRMFELNVEQTI